MAEKEKTDKISNVKTLIKLVQGDKENKTPGAISALGSKYRDLQRKIDNAVALSRSRAQERKRAKEEELEKQRQAELEKKAKPVFVPEPEVKAEPVEQPAVKPEVKETVAEIKSESAPEIKTEKSASEVKTEDKGEKKERIHIVTPEPPKPSFVRGMYTPPPAPEKRPAKNPQERPNRGKPEGKPFGDKGGFGAKKPMGDRPTGQRPSVGKVAPVDIPTVKENKRAHDKKKDYANNKPEDKKTMSRRTLIRKGFIPDEVGEERMGTRKLKNKKVVAIYIGCLTIPYNPESITF